MAFTIYDDRKVRDWFSKLEDSREHGTSIRETVSDYYKYRDLITNLILNKMNDLFRIKTYEWKKRNFVREEDSQSIIHDAILATLESFKIKSNVKFVTYFWKVLHSRLFNHINKYKKLKEGQTKHIPSPLLHSLDYLFLNNDNLGHKSYAGSGKYKNTKEHLSSLVSDYLLQLSSDEDERQDHIFIVDYILTHLPNNSRFILESILKGYTHSEIADTLGITKEAVRLRINKIRKRFKSVEKQLCQTRKQF